MLQILMGMASSMRSIILFSGQVYRAVILTLTTSSSAMSRADFIHDQGFPVFYSVFLLFLIEYT